MQTFNIGQEIVKKSASIENDNKQENPQSYFKKIRNIKGTFARKVGTVKYSQGRGANQVKKRWKGYIDVPCMLQRAKQNFNS